MEACPELDVDYLEEIESRLYSQVFHSTTGNEEFSDTFKPTQVNREVPLRNFRYFAIPNLSKDIPPSTSTFIPLVNYESSTELNEKANIPFVQNNISFTPTSTTVVTDHNFDNVQNNITVNQFTVPLIIHSDYTDTAQLLSPRTNSQYINPWSYDSQKQVVNDKNKRVRKKKQRSKKRGKKASLINSAVEPISAIPVNPIVSVEPDEVITLSDESSNECVLVEDMESESRVNTEFPKRYDETGCAKKPESDDDIIYIPPPTPEVINIDVDETEESVSTNITKSDKRKSKSLPETNINSKERNIPLNPTESTGLNDFLDTASVESSTKFNFGLHGVDFNSQSDFVKPPNPDVMPVESCETESSCSTNEHSRDFSNTVKTIVFDEVEFPREDIFSEKNLESFKTFITPQRNLKSQTVLNKTQLEKVSNKLNKVIDTSNSESSSESDYQEPELRNKNYENVDFNKKLPILSPMVTEHEHISKKKDKSSYSAQASLQSSKRKSDAMEKSNSEDNSYKNLSNSKASRKSRKKRKKWAKSSQLKSTEESSGDEKTKKKKKNSEKKEVSVYASTLKRKSTSESKSYNKGSTDTFEISEKSAGMNSKKRKKKSELIATPVDKEKSKKKKKIKDTTECVAASELDTEPISSRDDIGNVHVETEVDESQLDTENANETAPIFEQNNADTIDLDNFIVVDSIDCCLSGLITVDEAAITDVEILHSDNGDDSNVFVDVGTDLQLVNCISVSQPLTNAADLPNDPSNNQQQEVHKPFDVDDIQKIQSVKGSEEPSDNEKTKKKKKNTEKEEVSVYASTPKRKSSSESKSYNEGSLDTYEISEQSAGINSKKRKKKFKLIATPVDKEKSKKKKKIKDTTEGVAFIESDTVPISSRDDFGNVRVETEVEESELDSENAKEAALILEQNNADIDLHDSIVADSIDNYLVDLITVDDATITDIEILDSDNEADSNVLVDVGTDLQLVNCISVSQPSTSAADLPNDPSNNQQQVVHKLFDVDDIQKIQSDDPEKWQISYRDRAIYLNMDRQKGPRCHKCRRFGHMAVKCTEKPEHPACVLCGTRGHNETRCRIKMCNQCGCHGDYNLRYCATCFDIRNTACQLCSMPGHSQKNCPDLWRRYHLTTTEGPIVVAEGPTLKPKDQLWCSGCARRGHLEHDCWYYQREYPPTTPEIFSYEDVLYPQNNNLPKISDVIVCAPASREAISYLPATVTSQSGCSNSKAIYPGPSMPNVPSLMSLSFQAPPVTTSNAMIELSNKVFNPFSVQNDDVPSRDHILNTMRLNFVNNSVPRDIRESDRLYDNNSAKNIIMTMPALDLMDYIRKDMEELETKVSQCNPKQLRKLLFMCERLSDKSLSKPRLRGECQTRYRKLNMFIFGIHEFRDGRLHMNYLKKFLSCNSLHLDEPKRKSILSSYLYIFGCDKHATVNYFKIINMIHKRFFNKNNNE